MTILNFLSALVILGILIFVHELGHFLFAKLMDVKVEKFSLGFGKKLAGWKSGETEYLISAFPLGGYVKMAGETDEAELTEEEKKRSFSGKNPWQRFVIIAAGPTFNLLFAYLVFSAGLVLGFPLDSSTVGRLLPDKPAVRAGLLAGDTVTTVNGRAVTFWDEMAVQIMESPGDSITLGVRRSGKDLSVTVPTEKITEKTLLGETITRKIIGIEPSGHKAVRREPVSEALRLGWTQTVNLIGVTLLMLVKLFQRAVPLDTIGGPIMIVAEAGKQAAAGGVNFLFFMGALSVNLGVLNLLPVPILDGGHLFFTLFEGIFRRPVSMRVREAAQQIGLVLLLSLMLLAFYNDILRYFVNRG